MNYLMLLEKMINSWYLFLVFLKNYFKASCRGLEIIILNL